MTLLKYLPGTNNSLKKDLVKLPVLVQKENSVHNATKVDTPKKSVGELANFANVSIIPVINATTNLKRKLVKPRR